SQCPRLLLLRRRRGLPVQSFCVASTSYLALLRCIANQRLTAHVRNVIRVNRYGNGSTMQATIAMASNACQDNSHGVLSARVDGNYGYSLFFRRRPDVALTAA